MKYIYALLAILYFSEISFASKEHSNAESWLLDAEIGVKATNGTLIVSRFKDPIYFLLRPINWKSELEDGLEVTVPKGFVTDFASIPRVFWSALRPDGEYTWAAVIHDYLYATQTTSRAEADNAFKQVMKEFEIDDKTITIIYKAVRLGGQSAWDENRKQRENGEKKVLKKFPDDPKITWEIWKNKSGVFKD